MKRTNFPEVIMAATSGKLAYAESCRDYWRMEDDREWGVGQAENESAYGGRQCLKEMATVGRSTMPLKLSENRVTFDEIYKGACAGRARVAMPPLRVSLNGAHAAAPVYLAVPHRMSRPHRSSATRRFSTAASSRRGPRNRGGACSSSSCCEMRDAASSAAVAAARVPHDARDRPRRALVGRPLFGLFPRFR